MANWQLRGHGELTEPATVRLPSMLEDVGPLPSAILTHLGRRLATKGAVNSAFVVIIAKRAQFPLQVQRIPEQRLVEKLSTYRSDQALNEGVAQRHIRHRLDRLDVQYPQAGLPSVISRQRIMIGAEITRKRVSRDHAIEHTAQRQTVHIANVNSKSDDSPAELIHHDRDPMGLQGVVA